MKKNIFFSIVAFVLLFSLIGCAKEEKFVGSKDTPDFGYDMTIYQSIEEIKDRSDLIVIAYYDDAPREKYFKDEGTGMELYSSRYSLHIEKVLKGAETEGNVITFSQVGKPDSNDYETKIKKGQKYLLFLCQKNLELTGGEILYDATGVEQGIVEIKSNNKLYSYYDEGIMQEYDGVDLSKLEAKIK